MPEGDGRGSSGTSRRGRSSRTTTPSSHQEPHGLMGTVNLRDLLRACPAPPVGRPRNPIRDAEVQWKGGAKSRES